MEWSGHAMGKKEVVDQHVEVVAVGAHPDDVEIALGGTLALLSRHGIQCGIIDLTNAEPTPANEKYRSPDDFDPDYDAKRLSEAGEAARILGVKDRMTLNLPNRRLFDSFESRAALATIFRKWRPSVVISLYGKTPMASPDHYQAQLITEGAIFYSRLTKWEKYFEGTPVHSIRKILYAPLRETGIHPEGEAGRLSSFFVDVSEVIEIKKNAILAYRSQFQEQGKERFVERITERNRTMGAMAGTLYAEHLASLAPIAFKDSSFLR